MVVPSNVNWAMLKKIKAVSKATEYERGQQIHVMFKEAKHLWILTVIHSFQACVEELTLQNRATR